MHYAQTGKIARVSDGPTAQETVGGGDVITGDTVVKRTKYCYYGGP